MRTCSTMRSMHIRCTINILRPRESVAFESSRCLDDSFLHNDLLKIENDFDIHFRTCNTHSPLLTMYKQRSVQNKRFFELRAKRTRSSIFNCGFAINYFNGIRFYSVRAYFKTCIIISTCEYKN